MFYFTILRRAGATNALLVTLLLPLTPLTLGSLFLGQTLKATDIAGGLLIAIALLVIDGRALGLARRSR
jgi:drug/metabolite transporter (DMT)-like permease